MIHCALTGGIGSGKSTVLEMFAQLGVPVFSADNAAKHAMHINAEIQTKLVSLFGTEAYNNGQLNRPFIAKQVFSDKKKLAALNAIVHPAVKNAYSNWCKQQNAPYTMYEFPLVFELHAADRFDKVILITAPKEVRIQRVQRRDNSNKEAILARMNNQWTDMQKIPLADIVIENIHIEETRLQVHSFHHKLMKAAKK